MSYRHPVAESAAAVEGNQEPDTVSSQLWRRLGSGGRVAGHGSTPREPWAGFNLGEGERPGLN